MAKRGHEAVVRSDARVRRAAAWALLACLISSRSFGQTTAPLDGSAMAELQRAQKRLMEEEAPEYYAFQQKIDGIEEEIAKIKKSFAAGEIDKDQARESLLPLVKEEQEIRDDPDFLVEQKLAQVSFSSPVYRGKIEKIVRAISERRKK